MLKIVFYLFILGAIVFGLDKLTQLQGRVVIELPGYTVEPSLAQLALILLLLIIFGIAVWTIIRLIIFGPESLRIFLSSRRERKGYNALGNALIALGSGHNKEAEHMSKKASNLLGSQPIIKLLEAQAAISAKDDARALACFEAMRVDEDSELIGLHGLFDLAVKQGDLAASYAFAQEAFEKSPLLEWAAMATLEGRVGAKNWDGALDVLASMGGNAMLDKPRIQRLRAVVLTAQAMDLETSKPKEALKHAEQAHNLAPEFVPAACVAGRLASHAHNFSKAAKILEKTWKLSAHPDLAEIYAHARQGDTVQDRLDRIGKLMKLHSSSDEAQYALASVAVSAGDFDLARTALDRIPNADKTRKSYVLLAEIAEAEHQDIGKAREWLAKAVMAPQDKAWIAEHEISEIWLPQSQQTGKVDVFEWAYPPIAEQTGKVIDAGYLKSLQQLENKHEDDIVDVSVKQIKEDITHKG